MTIEAIGRLSLEYDGSIVVCGEVVGKLEADCLTPEQTNEFNAELVRRWNHYEGGEMNTKKEEKVEVTPMRIHGNALSMILIHALNEKGEKEVLEIAKNVVSGLTEKEIMMIAKQKAYLDGNSVDGLTFTVR